jgi:hypothetical protein
MSRKTVLFYRHFKRFAGHHLKVWDYFNHVLASPEHTAAVYFSPESRLDDTNPWTSVPDRVVDSAADVDADLLFLSGMDWRQVDPATREDSPVPLLNLVQHPTNTEPDNPRYEFLSNKAIRICISPEMAERVEATGRARGPVFTIPDAIDVAAVRSLGGSPPRDVDVLVAALKNPEMGQQVARRLRRPQRIVQLLDRRLTHRSEVLELLARAKLTVFVPWHEEGFYLPALEGMALGTAVVCPDVLGNRSFCRPDVNCFRPRYEPDAIVAAAEEALAELPNLGPMLEKASQTAEDHDIARERESFLEILRRVDELWAESP